MEYLNHKILSGFNEKAFKHAQPYPWSSIDKCIHPDKYQELIDTLPNKEIFREVFGKKRKFGQMSHDRLALDYDSELPISDAWHAFVNELMSDQYREFIYRIAGTKNVELDFHWHYTPNGCSVSPHCDSNSKIGSHIFYLNTEQDWQSDWGGDTLILDDDGRFKRSSSPSFSDFHKYYKADSIGNRSLLFIRNGNSWHGVQEINCPADRLRKVFIVVIKKASPKTIARRIFKITK